MPRGRVALCCALPLVMFMIYGSYSRVDDIFGQPRRRTGPCGPGTWKLMLATQNGSKCTIQNESKCTIKRHGGGKLCGREGTFRIELRGDACQSYKISKVRSCGPKDLKCAKYDCKAHGVLRLESAAGNLVDVGSEDKMLTCGNAGFVITERR